MFSIRDVAGPKVSSFERSGLRALCAIVGSLGLKFKAPKGESSVSLTKAAFTLPESCKSWRFEDSLELFSVNISRAGAAGVTKLTSP